MGGREHRQGDQVGGSCSNCHNFVSTEDYKSWPVLMKLVNFLSEYLS